MHTFGCHIFLFPILSQQKKVKFQNNFFFYSIKNSNKSLESYKSKNTRIKPKN